MTGLLILDPLLLSTVGWHLQQYMVLGYQLDKLIRITYFLFFSNLRST